jgi:phosphoribosylglycinamide formyltransferase-1
MVKKIAVFSSGRGGNFNNICKYFSVVKNVSVNLLVTNNLDSMSKKIAEINKVDAFYADKAVMLTGKLNKALEERGIDLIVLAGFVLKIPESLVKKYEKKIINLHPSLLPKFGGKGMYGDNVHKAVLKHNEKFTGITIHYVDEVYDNGEIIFQKRCDLALEESLVSLREKIRLLEYEFFPKIIENLLS